MTLAGLLWRVLLHGKMAQVSSDVSSDVLGLVGRQSEGPFGKLGFHWSSILLSEDSLLLSLFIAEVAPKVRQRSFMWCGIGHHGGFTQVGSSTLYGQCIFS